MRKSNNEIERQPFLETSGDDEPEKKEIPTQPRSPERRHRFSILNTIFLVVNIGLLAWNLASKQCPVAQDAGVKAPFSPARSSLQYSIRNIDTHPKDSVFAGKPRPELDQAWSKLLRGSLIRLSEDEMRVMNKTSIALKDGSGYIGYLESFHMLHCVKRLYQSWYPEYYTDLASSGRLSTPHLEHCMEVLRQGIMCNADVSVNTYRWDLSSVDLLKGQNMQPRKCVDWSLVEAWANDRAVVGRDYEQLVPYDQPDAIGPAPIDSN